MKFFATHKKSIIIVAVVAVVIVAATYFWNKYQDGKTQKMFDGSLSADPVTQIKITV